MIPEMIEKFYSKQHKIFYCLVFRNLKKSRFCSYIEKSKDIYFNNLNQTLSCTVFKTFGNMPLGNSMLLSYDLLKQYFQKLVKNLWAF